MRIGLLMGGILAAACGIGTPAQAQNYPWCAVYGFGRGGGAMNCGFTSHEQCMATVSGIGGFCQVNTTYQPPVAGPRPHYRGRPRHHHHHRHS